jgi:hypothetical protein
MTSMKASGDGPLAGSGPPTIAIRAGPGPCCGIAGAGTQGDESIGVGVMTSLAVARLDGAAADRASVIQYSAISASGE